MVRVLINALKVIILSKVPVFWNEMKGFRMCSSVLSPVYIVYIVMLDKN